MRDSKVNILDVVPCRRSHIFTYIEKNGKIRLGILRFKSKWINKYLLPKSISPEIKVPLDIYGSEVWKLINGKNTIATILAKMKVTFDGEDDFDERIVQYLYQLKKDKLIDFMSSDIKL